MRNFIKVLMVGVFFTLAGCANSPYNSSTYDGSQANTISGYEVGFVDYVRPVQIRNSTSGVGAVAGAGLGAIAASNIGGGTGKYVASAIGALTGGLIGNKVESNTTSKTNAVEVSATLDSGKNIVVVQEDNQNLKRGERIKLIGTNGKFRIVRF